MIFGITYFAYLKALGIIMAWVWIVLYFGFVTGSKSSIDISKYFRAMFNGYRNSTLRIGWSSLIFGLEYILGIIIAGFIKSAWYPSIWTRNIIGKILFKSTKE